MRLIEIVEILVEKMILMEFEVKLMERSAQPILIQNNQVIDSLIRHHYPFLQFTIKMSKVCMAPVLKATIEKVNDRDEKIFQI